MSQHAELMARYKHLRKVGLELNHRLVKTLNKSIIEEGGKKLGILKGKTLMLDTEDESSVLMDYCIHDVRRQGMNAVERYLAESPPPADSDEMVLLQALRQSRFCVVAVDSAEPEIGVHGRDLLRDVPLFLLDIGFSRAAVPGMVLATRVMAPEGNYRTTGAALPVGVLSPAQQAEYVHGLAAIFKGMDLRKLSPQQTSEFSATVIRVCLEQGAAKQIQYIEPVLESSRRAVTGAPPPRQKIGRNDRCPCGSGKKFKHCCGRGR